MPEAQWPNFPEYTINVYYDEQTNYIWKIDHIDLRSKNVVVKSSEHKHLLNSSFEYILTMMLLFCIFL